MSSTSEKQKDSQIRTYDRAKSVVFLKTNEAFGGLSNMAGGFPLKVNGLRILTSEALYQVCRFPHRPEVQRLIIGQTSPMTAKMKSKPHRRDSRPDWDRVRVKIMRWCLRVKLAQNWAKFSDLLLATGERAIVEQSRKDDFWGAKAVDEHTLVGRNVLGRLLMELREAIKAGEQHSLLHVGPLAIPDFLLDGCPIQAVTADSAERRAPVLSTTESREPAVATTTKGTQAALFEQPAVKEAPALYVSRGHAQAAELGDLKPYPAMKDSGVPWLGEVPAQWEVRRIKTLFREKNERSGDGRGVLLSLTRMQGIVPQAEASNRIASAEDLSKYKVCRPGDLVMNRMQAWSGMFALSSREGLVSPDYSVFRSIGSADVKYFEHLFKTPVLVDQFAQRSKGIGSGFNRLYTPDFGAVAVVLPPLPEQSSIVRFLDHADRRIRRYIHAKRKLIALLNEQKQAIIHRAVTRGLDPNVRLKPSGVEWLGDVPEHWEMRRLKFLAHIKTGGRDTVHRKEDGAYPFFVRSQTIERIDTYTFDGEAVLTAGDGAGVAKVFHYVNGKFDYHQRVYKFSNFRRVKGRFFFHYFSNTLRFEAFRETAKSTVDSLRLPMLQDFPVVLPPPGEQDHIVEWIDHETSGLDTSLAAIRREIGLLREYYTRLIADVVTGKLNVREAAAGLPDEPEETEPQEEAEALADGDEDGEEAGIDTGAEEATV